MKNCRQSHCCWDEHWDQLTGMIHIAGWTPQKDENSGPLPCQTDLILHCQEWLTSAMHGMKIGINSPLKLKHKISFPCRHSSWPAAWPCPPPSYSLFGKLGRNASPSSWRCRQGVLKDKSTDRLLRSPTSPRRGCSDRGLCTTTAARIRRPKNSHSCRLSRPDQRVSA